MNIKLENANAKKAKEVTTKRVAELEKKYADQFGPEWFNDYKNKYKETTVKVASYLLEGVKEVHKILGQPNGQFSAVTVEFDGNTIAVVTGFKNEDGSIHFEVCSNKQNIPIYGSDMFAAIFNNEAVDLLYGQLKGKKVTISLVSLKKDYDDLNKFYKELVNTMVTNATENEQINIWVNKETA
jgi:hypothetical protein